MDTKGECPICLESLKNGEELVQLQPCKHFYHEKCLGTTIINGITNCCVCRGEYTTISKKSLTIEPYIPFSLILKSEFPLFNLTPGTRVYRVKQDGIYETMLNTNSIKIFNNIIYIEISNYLTNKKILLNIEGVDKVSFSASEFGYEGLNCITMFFTENIGKCKLREIKFLIPQAMKEVNELWDIINNCLESKGDLNLITTVIPEKTCSILKFNAFNQTNDVSDPTNETISLL